MRLATHFHRVIRLRTNAALHSLRPSVFMTCTYLKTRLRYIRIRNLFVQYVLHGEHSTILNSTSDYILFRM